jgi:hypothetical protein
MIVSHAHKFIFLKTHKTAGSSAELVLSRFCGPEDVITPLEPADEEMRIGRGPQNYTVLPTWRAKFAKFRWQLRGLGPYSAYSQHTGAERIRWVFGERTWKSYFKFAIERNPWDRELSRYFWDTKAHQRPSFEEFIRSTRPLANFNIYSIDGHVAVDTVIRYENFANEFLAVLRHIGLSDAVEMPKAKASSRTDRRHYREFYSPESRDIIASRYVREISTFGYTF